MKRDIFIFYVAHLLLTCHGIFLPSIKSLNPFQQLKKKLEKRNQVKKETCTPRLIHGNAFNSSALDVLVAIYVREQFLFGQNLALTSKKYVQSITENEIINVGFLIYDLSCDDSKNPLEKFIDILLSDTLNHARPFQIAGIIADIKTDELNKMADILSPYSVPLFSFISDGSKIKYMQSVKKYYDNVVPISKSFLYRINLLKEFSKTNNLKLMTIVCDMEEESRNVVDDIIKSDFICISNLLQFLTIQDLNNDTVRWENTAFILAVTSSYKAIQKLVKLLCKTPQTKILYIFYSFDGNTFKLDSPTTELVTVEYVKENYLQHAYCFFGRVCLIKTSSTVVDRFYEKLLNSIIKSVQYIENNLDDMQYYNRIASRQYSSKLVKLMRNVSRGFTKGGLILYHNSLANNRSIKKPFMSYNWNGLRTNITWHTSITLNLSTFCDVVCMPGHYPIYIIGKCCWKCISCDADTVKKAVGLQVCSKCDKSISMANKNQTECLHYKYDFFTPSKTKVDMVLVLSLSGFLYTVFFLSVFAIYRDTPVVKASNFLLSVIQLSIHAMLNMHIFISILPQVKIICIGNVIVGGYLLKLVIGIYIIKTNQLLSVFKSKTVLRRTVFLKLREMLIPGMFLTANSLLTLILFEEFNVTYGILKGKNGLVRYKYCNVSFQFYIDILSVISMSLICSIQAFRSRHLPANYNEAKYVTVAMFTSTIFLILSIPLDASLRSKGISILVDSYVIYCTNVAVLSITYGYKIFIILFQKEKNISKYFQEKTFQSFQQHAPKKVRSVPTS